jgi:hypothetical protein
MGESNGFSRMSKMLFVALLSVVFLAGCHGSLGWNRARTPVACQNQGGLDPSQQVDVGHEDADRPAEHDALAPSAEKNLVVFQECASVPRCNVV